MRLRKTRIILSMVLALVLVFGSAAPARAAKKSWKKLYLEYLNTLPDGVFQEGKFIYVNNDKTPELYLQGNSAAAGNQLLTIYNGIVYSNMISGHASFTYLKKKNRYYISGGHMDIYFDYIGKLSKGKMSSIAEGDYGAEDNSNIKFDKDGNPIYRYYWNNKEVSRKSYEKKLDRKLGKNKGKYKDAYSYGNMKTIDQIKNTLD